MIVRGKEEILESMLSNFSLQIPVYEGTITHAIFSSVANAIAREYSIKDEEEKQIFLVDGRTEFLDKRASEFGYDRKDGEPAVGDVIFQGDTGTLVKEELLIKCNGMDYRVVKGCTIGENREGRAVAMASNVGADGNIKAGSEFTCESQRFERIFAENDFKNGIDIETDEDFYTRFFYTQRHKGTSGNEEHYDEWAKSVDGIIDAKTTGLKNGAGTVEVVVSSKNNTVDGDTIKKVKDYIEKVRPIGASVTVKSMSDFEIDLNIKVKSHADMEIIKHRFLEDAEVYLENCSSNIVYSKLYSVLASIEEVEDVVLFELNGATVNISINSDQKAKLRNVSVEVVENV